MCHAGVLECVTLTQDKFTPENNSSVHKITNVDAAIPRLGRLVRPSSKVNRAEILSSPLERFYADFVFFV